MREESEESEHYEGNSNDNDYDYWTYRERCVVDLV